MARFERYAQGTPSYVELLTSDQAAAKRFYGPLFGWELEDVPLGPEITYVAVSKEGDQIAGISPQQPELAGHPAFWSVYVTVDDIEAVTARVAGAGGRVEAEPSDVMDLGRTATIADPTGARINLWQPGTTIGTIRANEPGTPVWHELLTRDVPAATAFYAEVLGVRWEEMPMEDRDSYPCLIVEDRAVAGAMALEMEEVPPHWAVSFDVEDADATTARAVELGGTVVAAPFDVPTVGRIAVLADPQGAMVSLMQSTG